MDKIKLSALGTFTTNPSINVKIGEAEISVYPKIPYEEVFDMIQWCVDHIILDRPFLSAPLERVITDFAVLKYYTNIDVDFLNEEHDLVDIYSEYDLVQQHHVLSEVLKIVDQDQYDFFRSTLKETLTSIVAYQNSAMGILNTLAQSADSMANRMDNAIQTLGDEEKVGGIINLIKNASELQ